MRHGLIDEFRILVHPVVLGQRRPLLDAPADRMDLRLGATRAVHTAWSCFITRTTAPEIRTIPHRFPQEPLYRMMLSDFIGITHDARFRVAATPSARLFLPVSSHQSTSSGIAVTAASPTAV